MADNCTLCTNWLAIHLNGVKLMSFYEFYTSVYSTLGNLTPLKGDCGRACNKACCEGDKDGDGMYLFPHEEEMYNNLPSCAAISETDFE